MARTESRMLALGTKAPAFKLKNTSGQTVTLETFNGCKGLLVMFICNHCPFVKHLRRPLARLTSEFMKKGVAVVAINANDAEKYPEDSPDKMASEKQQQDYEFDYLFDETQDVAKAYQAACTPDFYLFNANLELVYRGQFDDSRPGGSVEPTGKDLKTAVENLLGGRAISQEQKPSLGCNIKWK